MDKGLETKVQLEFKLLDSKLEVKELTETKEHSIEGSKRWIPSLDFPRTNGVFTEGHREFSSATELFAEVVNRDQVYS
uniref:Uncharacterized protein n=1 Tax=Solanum tuberosum TaxID=4113 RepID=M1CZV7_SOLTU